ncbi:MAG: V-type ATP synthase subunit D [Bacteroidales bacterium]|nr:V-type ATP synthase subunit D [Bacteroidales bacterium]
MAIKFQYNKTSLQNLNKQLMIRVRTLPTIKNKESALRIEVKKARDMAHALEDKINGKFSQYEEMIRMWAEFDPSLITVKDVKLSVRKIAGVQIPVFDEVLFSIREYSLFNTPHWFPEGIEIIKDIIRIALEREFFYRKMLLLDHARKKTTQKVNLYEKVQIPGYDEAILKIRRFLEDEENLAKSSQKIVKTRQQETEAA